MSMYKEIKTVTTGATERAVTFTDEHSYVYAKNIGDTDVYLSALSGIVAGADDVALCAAGDTAQICPVGKTIYVLGASTIEFHATNTDNSPFKKSGKGGDDPVIEALSVTANGTYTAGERVDGYNPITVNVPQSVTDTTITENGVHIPPSNMAGFSKATVIVPFYPREDTPLDLITSVETMDMHTEPTIGTRYYPRLFLMSTPYPNPEQEDPTDRGKYFAPTDANYAVTAYIDIINKETGESVEGYPQIVNTSAASYGINSDGYIRLKGWKVITSGNHLKVAVTTTRWNTTYSNPIDDTYSTQSDVETWLSAYTTAPYVIKDDRWAVIDSGSCGDNATYVLYRNGTLVISGTGALWAKSQITWDSTKVVDVLVGEGITALGSELFKNYRALKTAHIPSTLTIFGGSCFYGSSIENVDIAPGISSISAYVFQNCTNLTALTLPNTVTYINNYVFSGCSSLTSLTVLATTPPKFNTYGPGIPSGTTIYVPYDSVNTYKTNTRWSSYADRIQPIVTISEVLRFDGEGSGDDISDFVDDRSDIVGLRIYGTENGIGYTAGDNVYVPIGQWTQTAPHAGQPGQWILTDTDFAIIPEVLYEDDYADVWELCSSPYGTGATAITGSSLGIQLSGGSTYSLICKGTTNEQSTRTLAMDPMIRSTLSTISDTSNIIEDD